MAHYIFDFLNIYFNVKKNEEKKQLLQSYWIYIHTNTLLVVFFIQYDLIDSLLYNVKDNLNCLKEQWGKFCSGEDFSQEVKQR